MEKRHVVPLLVIGGMLLSAGAVMTLVVGTIFSHPHKPEADRRIDDMNSLKNLARTMQSEGYPLDNTGRLDIYGLYGDVLELRENNVRLCFSRRMNRGATFEDIKNRNYAAFPWARRVGKPIGEKVVPLLWEPTGDSRLVVFSDMSVHVLKAAKLEEMLK